MIANGPGKHQKIDANVHEMKLLANVVQKSHVEPPRNDFV